MPEQTRASPLDPSWRAPTHEHGQAPAPVSRLAVVGVSLNATCGVRDHASQLAAQLEREGVGCTCHWLHREQRSLSGSRREVLDWAGRLEGELAQARPEAILLHYSIFSFSHKGLPLFVRPVLAPLRRARVPLIAFMHELAYPFGPGGLRGVTWATTQRVALREVVDSCAATIVTADFRASWLGTRRWLPRRPLLLAPVFATIPPPRAAPGGDAATRGGERGHVLGMFGYSYESAAAALVLDALRELRGRGIDARLQLLGAPGRASTAGEEWCAAARARGVEEALSFSGALPAQDLSDALAACEVLVFGDASGPTSRKTTLAASLASGVALVAIDGPRTWRTLVEQGAAVLAPPSSAALADAIDGLLADAPARRALGARGRAFAEREMSLAATAQAVRTLLGQALSERPA